MAKDYPKARAPRSPLVTRECQACDKSFMAKQSNIKVGKGLFCGQECQRNGRKTRSDKKARPSHVCQWCGKVFVSETNQAVDVPRKYCSNQCLGRSKRKDNKEHPRRKQAVELQRWTREVILRDKSCVRCGVRESLQAHHIEPYSKRPDLGLDVDNGVALCPVCHHAQHPKHNLALYLGRGGQKVQYCAACEGAFVPGKRTQRTCSPKCGCDLRYGSKSLTTTNCGD